MVRPPRPVVLVVLAVLALVVAVAGGAEAGRKITGKQIKNHSITEKDLKTGTLTGSAIADGSLGSADLAAAAREELRSGRPVAVTGALVAPAAGGTVSVSAGQVGGRTLTLTCKVYSGYVGGSLAIDGVTGRYRGAYTATTNGGSPVEGFPSGTGTGSLVLADIPQVLAFDNLRLSGTTWISLPTSVLRVDYDLAVAGHANGHACDVMGLAVQPS